MTPENIQQIKKIAKIAIPIFLFIILFSILYTITKKSKQDTSKYIQQKNIEKQKTSKYIQQKNIEKQKTIQSQQSDVPIYLVQL